MDGCIRSVTFLRLLALAVLVVTCAPASSAGQSDGAAARSTLERLALQQPSTALFAFHSNPWINLHHLLVGGRPVPADWPEADRAEWDEGLEFYRRYARRSLLFDRELLDIKNALRTAEGNVAGP